MSMSANSSAALPPHYADELMRLGRHGGLDAVGVCTAAVFGDARAAIEVRKSAGLNGDMQFTYRDPARSTDPGAAVPGARALVVGALAYRRRSSVCEPEIAARGAIGAYAWRDYYADLRTALAPIADRLRADGHRAIVAVDDNALVDRAAAVRAGLGWYGKNANVLLPGEGSWFVLGAVITDAPLVAADPAPVPDGCGACRRCIDSCPTHAIVAPGVVDARRCLSWLLQATEFPRDYRRAVGHRFYGCDDCQEYCPPNRRADAAAPTAEAAAVPAVDVTGVLTSSDERLEADFARLYFAQRDVNLLRRNALIVLGNSGATGPRVRDVLRRYLADGSAQLRAHAVWASRRLGYPELADACRDDPDARVRAEFDEAP